MKVVVTGANGFIGSHLCDYLLAQDTNAVNEIMGLVGPSGRLANLTLARKAPHFTYAQIDLLDKKALTEALKGASIVYHVAAKAKDWGPQADFERSNVEATKVLLEVAQACGVQRFVLLSSIAVHAYTGFVNADTRQLPRDGRLNYYSISKKKAEDLVMASALETVIIRPALVPFGSRDPNLARLAQALKTGFFPLVARGKARINTVYVENLVYGIALAGNHPNAANKIYFLADADNNVTWQLFFAEMAKILSVKASRLSLPASLAHMLGYVEDIWTPFFANKEPPMTHYRARLMKQDIHLSMTAAQRELGYVPPIVWQEALAKSLS